MIAVISHPEDPHAQRVIQHLEAAGQQVFLLNLADLPHAATLTIDYLSNGQPQLEYRRMGQASVDLTQVHTAWWRRPQAANVASVTDPDVRLFTANEWNEAISGLWQLLGARWMNDPMRDEVAARKALQLRVAAESGLRIPRTLITSDPDKARGFITSQGLGRTIYKTFSCTHAIWRETRLIREQDLSLLDTVRVAPVIFQEFIPADADLRITVIGDQLFPAAIVSKDTDYPVDFRMSLGQAKTRAVELPEKVAMNLRRFMRRLGLVYGACDMRLTPDGDYVFLEVNTAGEFLFVEERTGQPISEALARWLAIPA
jgi:glutathione synthase/RimK-type ligase-like ATP-grasp enzyme